MKELKFVDVGEGITEGHVHKWHVKDGDMVKEDQPIVQVETDKAIVDVPAPIGGLVKINAPENTDVHLGDVVAYIGTAEEIKNVVPVRPGAAARPAPQQQQQAAAMSTLAQQPAATTQTQQPAQRRGEVIATPAVRKLARDLDVDISAVAGTGPGGRVTESDVRGAAEKHGGAAPRQAAGPAQVAAVPQNPFAQLEAAHIGEVERVPMSMLRKSIARAMEESWKIPRAVHMDIMNAMLLYDTTAREKPRFASQYGVKLTFLPFIIKALVEALKENPYFNASLDTQKGEILLKKYYNIGLGAESPDGLKLIVVKNADKKNVAEIARDIQVMHDKVQNGTITLEEMRDSTFSITNIGSLGGGFLSVPMINPPEIGILGIHAVRDMPISDGGQVKSAKVLPFSISLDHRVVDGAEAVKLGNALIKMLQDPSFYDSLLRGV